MSLMHKIMAEIEKEPLENPTQSKKSILYTSLPLNHPCYHKSLIAQKVVLNIGTQGIAHTALGCALCDMNTPRPRTLYQYYAHSTTFCVITNTKPLVNPRCAHAQRGLR